MEKKAFTDHRILLDDVHFHLGGFQNSLHNAAQLGEVSTVHHLLRKGVHVDEQDIDGNTPLIYACESHQIQVMDILIKNGADVNHKSKKTFSPLHHAVCRDDKEAVELLLKHRAKVNITNGKGNTPLHLAALKGYLEICTVLKKAGANAELKNKSKETALDHAKKHTSNLYDILNKGLKNKAKPPEPKKGGDKDEKDKKDKKKEKPKKKPICQKSSKQFKPIDFKISTKLFSLHQVSEELCTVVEASKK